MFGAGGGTSSYEETRSADLIVLWGSNAREAHPIFFHHVLKAVNDGAQLAMLHRLEHPGQVKAMLCGDRGSPRRIELCPGVVVEDVLEAGQLVGDRPHVSPALDVVLPP